MILDVYADLYFLINFSMDLICFYLLASILHIKLPLRRAVIASAVGGVYSVCALIFGVTGIIGVILDALICLFMIIIIYLERGRRVSYYLALSALYLGISMLIGGIMSAIFTFLNRLGVDTDSVDGDSISIFLFAAIAVVSAILSLRGTRTISKKGGRKMCRVRVKMDLSEKSFSALVDSGNMVESPLGKGVIFLDRESAVDLLPRDADKQFLSGEYTLHSAGAIPISTAAGESICVTFKPDSLFLSPIDERGNPLPEYQSDCLISITDIKDADYNAIIPETAIRII